MIMLGGDRICFKLILVSFCVGGASSSSTSGSGRGFRRSADCCESTGPPCEPCRQTFSGPPRIQEFRFLSQLSVGDTAVVSCVVRKGGAEPFHLEWSKDGRPVDQMTRLSASNHFHSISTLTIRDITPEDNGNYTCVARNADGTDESSAVLKISGIYESRQDVPSSDVHGCLN